MVPEYPEEIDVGSAGQLAECEANGETDHGSGIGDSVASEPVADAVPDEQPAQAMTMKDLEDQIRRLQRLLGLLFARLLFVLGNVCSARCPDCWLVW